MNHDMTTTDPFATPPATQQSRPSIARRIWRSVREIVIILVLALILSFVIKTFFFRAFVIPSGSMENTLQIGDRIFVNLMVDDQEDLKHGDIIVFEDREGWLPTKQTQTSLLTNALETIGVLPDSSEQHLVKRIMGMPGDHVTVDPESGNIVINGEAVDEPYLYPGVAGSDILFDVTVPAGQLWVMGDHRNASGDSRTHQDGPNNGFVDIDTVVGRAEIIVWPIDRFGPAGSNDTPFTEVPAP